MNNKIIKQILKPIMSRIYKGLIAETLISVNKINGSMTNFIISPNYSNLLSTNS